MGALEPINGPLRLPLSAAQQGIWLGQQLDPLSPAYWTAEALELKGALDISAFERALTRTLNSCEALHMRFVGGADALEQEYAPAPWILHRPVLKGTDSDTRLQAVWRWIEQDLQSPPDLARGPIFSTSLLEITPEHHFWVLRVHHIALDGYGYALIARRLAALYAEELGTDSSQAEQTAPRARLADVIQEAMQYQQQAAADRAFWVNRLNNAPKPVRLAADSPMARHIQRLPIELPLATQHSWQEAAQQAGVDWATWVLAVTAAWIHSQTGAADITLGLPVMTRLGSKALTVPCMAMNIIPLRLNINPEADIASLCQKVSAEMRALRPHQRYRYEWLKQDLTQTQGRRPLFGPVVNLMPFERPSRFGNLHCVQHPVSAGPVEDLSISVVPHESGIRLTLEANPNAYSSEELKRLQQGLLQTLEVFSQAPERSVASLGTPCLSLLEAEPLAAGVDILSALNAHAARTPHAIALEQAGKTLSYAQLAEEVYALAGVLVTQGVTPGSRVALLLPRSPETVVALLAILWLGAAYVPLDPESPDARIHMVLEDALPQLVLSHSQQVQRLPEGMAHVLLDQPLPRAAALSQPYPAQPEDPAYVIYTSGTTGKPNGVMISRKALGHFVAAARQRYAVQASDRILQFAPLHFDASVEEIFLALASGATLVLRTDAMLDSMSGFVQACHTQSISILDLPTAFWHELAYALSPSLQLPESLRVVIIGGEAALPERVKRWQEQAPAHTQLFNTYGPTEATVICTTAVLSGPQAVAWESVPPIGQPLAGVTLAVLDEHQRLLPYGQRGELYILGETLALGYLGRPEQTAARFVTLGQLPNAPRGYRTGDAVSLREDGALLYWGRLDGEFKISGHRIDPTEIETHLLAHPEISLREVAVLGQTLPSGSKRLVAFVVLEDSPADLGTDLASALRAHLAKTLPAPAVPGTFIQCGKLPRNANNKIDRSALKVLAEQQLHSTQSETAHALEQQEGLMRCIAQVWHEVLGVEDLTADSDFFALGGQSLQAIQVTSRLSSRLQRDVAVSSLFRYPQLGALTEALAVPQGHEPPPQQNPLSAVLCLHKGEGPNLFCLPPTSGLAWGYVGLALHLPQHRLYGLQAPGILGQFPETPDQLLEYYHAHIRATQPQGPYHLLGWSAGGGIAHALAARLQAAGEEVALLALLDAYPAHTWAESPLPTEQDALIPLLGLVGDSAYSPEGDLLDAASMRERLMRPDTALASAFSTPEQLQRLIDNSHHSMLLYRDFEHPKYRGTVLYFLATQGVQEVTDWRAWQAHVEGNLEVFEVSCSHHALSQPEHLAQIGRTLAQHFMRLESSQDV